MSVKNMVRSTWRKLLLLERWRPKWCCGMFHKVFGLSQSEANRWSKAIPNALKMTLALAYEQSNQLRELATFNERNETMFAVAKVLEGLPRHVSTHAAGVVISDKNLLDLVPLQQGSDEILLTQFTMNDVETVGLLKMDFLQIQNI